MKTRFDEITESPESLAEFITDIECGCCWCCNGNKECTIQEEDGVFGEFPICEKGITEWLQQPLPMNEQFTDEDIEIAKGAKQQYCKYVAKNDILDDVYVFSRLPVRKGRIWLCPNGQAIRVLRHDCFTAIKWEDEPILLDDIINSRNIQKTIDK